MSNAGKPGNRVPPILKPKNGDSPVTIPDDIVWDEANPPTVFACTQHTTHAPHCDGTCPSEVLDESGVGLANEARAWARAGMSFKGRPDYLDFIPNFPPGINVSLFDLMMQVDVLTELICELQGISREEFDVAFRNKKLQFMREVQETNEASVRRNRAANALGITDKKIILP